MIQVDDTRPYEPLGMTTELWANILPSVVEVHLLATIGRLVMSQPHVSIVSLLSDDPPLFDTFPHLVNYRQMVYVVDGHHRVVRALLAREPIRARILIREPHGL